MFVIITIMFDTSTLELKIQELIVDICTTLYQYGFREVPVGAIMRLIGVDNTVAAQHDDQFFNLDSEFEALMQQNKKQVQHQQAIHAVPPAGTTFH